MSPKRKVKVSLSMVAVVSLIMLPFLLGFVGNSATRVEREHGLRLPPSASRFVCRGDAWIPVLDRVAASTFQIAGSDLTSFTNQLKMHTPDGYGRPPSPHSSPTNIASYYCSSPTGDF